MNQGDHASEALAPGINRFGRFLRMLPGLAAGADAARLTTISNRSRSGGLSSRLITGWPRRGVHQLDRTIPGRTGAIPVRIYTPERDHGTPRPLVIAMHGGGWALGGLDMADWMSSTVALDLDAVVLSVDYRLTPAHPFPAAVEDCFDALTWSAASMVALGATAGRLGVMGESAGGNLAAVLCLLARDQGGPAIHHQALIYPSTDLAEDKPFRSRPASSIILNDAEMKTYRDFYVGDFDAAQEWRLSPLRAPGHRGLPPALIQVAGHDPIRDDGIRYGDVLSAAGVPVVLTDYPSMPHGFVNFPYFSRDAMPAMRQVVAEQRKALAPGP